MNEKTGKVYQALRKSKHLSMNDVADSEISQSQISRFERGESSLTIDKFLKVLQNTSVGLDEFQNLFDHFSLSEEDQFRESLAKAYESGNLAQLRRMLKIWEDKSTGQPLKKYLKINTIVIRTALSNLVTFKMPKADIDFLENYLMNVEDWGRYELWAFSNTIQLFDDGTLNLLAGAILQRTTFYANVAENQRLIIRTLLNLVSHFIQRENFRLALKYIGALDQLHISIDFLYEKLMLRYNKGFYRYKLGDKAGLRVMKECNEILGTLGCFEQENSLDKEMQNLENQ